MYGGVAGEDGRPFPLSRFRAFSELLRRTDSVLGELIGQGASREPHAPSGFSLRSMRGIQSTQDRFFLGTLKHSRKVEGRREGNRKLGGVDAIPVRWCGFFLRKRQIVGPDLLIAAENVGALDQVLGEIESVVQLESGGVQAGIGGHRS